MPLQRCSLGKTSGWRWGNSGKCYISKKDALKQGYAEGPNKFKQEMSKSEHCTAEELEEFFEGLIDEGEIDRYDFYSQAYITKQQRDSIPLEDFALPSQKKYPCDTLAHFKAATKLYGRAPKALQPEIKRNLIKISKRKNYPLPKAWLKNDNKK